MAQSNVKQHRILMVAAVAIALGILAYLFGTFRRASCYNRGTAHLNRGEYDQAIECFGKAIELDSQFAEAYCNRGTAYVEKEQYEQAIGDFSEAIRINPEFSEAYHNRAIVYFKVREFEKARSDVQKAQSLGHRVDPELLQALSQQK